MGEPVARCLNNIRIPKFNKYYISNQYSVVAESNPQQEIEQEIMATSGTFRSPSSNELKLLITEVVLFYDPTSNPKTCNFLQSTIITEKINKVKATRSIQ